MRGPYVLLLFMALGFNAGGFYWCAFDNLPAGAALHAFFTIAAFHQLIQVARGRV